jgi:hypothetical protein
MMVEEVSQSFSRLSIFVLVFVLKLHVAAVAKDGSRSIHTIKHERLKLDVITHLPSGVEPALENYRGEDWGVFIPQFCCRLTATLHPQ